MRHPSANLEHRTGFRNEDALCGIAAQFAQPITDHHRFDAFGHDGQPEVMGEVDRGPHDPVIVARGQAADQGPVNLQLVDGQLAEIAQRGVARAHVLDREPDAHVVQAPQARRCPRRVRHHEGFRHLQHEC